ncbi:hypothetical protein, partial [Aeromonas allosaccharophila]|uniref:hypothetical protein n=1 Tax=Aeromonas allosaccharophila TaxID=656 RepID=UPI002B46DA2E
PRNPSRSKKRLLKTALRDNYLEKRRPRRYNPFTDPLSGSICNSQSQLKRNESPLRINEAR